MKNEVVIKVDNLTKVFKLPHEKYATAKQTFVNLFARSSFGRLKALDNVSFKIKKGEFFSIIGSNGSGKSTLLKILAQIYLPTSGKVEVEGRVSPFIELGVGFNPELTARENVFLNAAILGLSKKETEERFGEIIKFAELEQFVDQQLKNFSSGMQVRLAFSIAIQAPAGILLIDEVLAVGDASFQQKCFGIFRKLKEKGTTIVFVSHALNIVKEFSDRAAFLNHGKLLSLGKSQTVINEYLSLITQKKVGLLEDKQIKGASSQKEQIILSKKQPKIIDVKFLGKEGNKKTVFKYGEPLNIRIYYDIPSPLKNAVFGIGFMSENERYRMQATDTRESGIEIPTISGKGHVDYNIELIPFIEGKYIFTVGIFDRNYEIVPPYYYNDEDYKLEVKSDDKTQTSGFVGIKGRWRINQK